MSEKYTLLFVCTGNICRSPMAEYIMRERLGEDSVWVVQSAGVMAMDGNPASHEAVLALDEWNIDLHPHRSQMLTKELIDASTLIVVMTEHHRLDVIRANPDAENRVHLLTSFSTANTADDVSDPIGGSLNVYRTVRDQIDGAISDLVLYMREKWGLT